MERFAALLLYQLGARLSPLVRLNTKQDHRWIDLAIPIWQAKEALDIFLTFSNVELTVCQKSARELRDVMRLVFPDEGAPDDINQQLDITQVFSIQEKAGQFETVLSAELESLHIYTIRQFSGYDTTTLIERAHWLFSSNVRSALTQKKQGDICEAGKCLAFGLPTACGFHLLRAVESEIKSYYHKLTGRELAVENAQRNWGFYIKELRDTGSADEKVLSILGQLKDLHRNPLMHPEDELTMEDADILVGIVKSAISAMANHALWFKSESRMMGLPR